MFTGLIQGLGEVVELGSRLEVRPRGELASADWQIGESVAVNGCCLTVIASSPLLTFELSPETMNRTAFHALKQGDLVNLERAMMAGDRFGGHIVQGHVDEIATIVATTERENAHIVRVRLNAGSERYIIDKGSITVDGISLTVVNPEQNEFDLWIIPHTFASTTISQWQAGTTVNIEFDVIAKHVEKLLLNQMVKS